VYDTSSLVKFNRSPFASDAEGMFKASPRWITVIVVAAGTATTSPIKMAKQRLASNFDLS
jgi:hypothetical protein